MIKRSILFMLLVACFLLISTCFAYADLIIEPANDFFSRNRRECVFLGRSFCVNGAVGSVSVKEAPGSKKEIAVIENREIIFLEYSCLYKGEYWGLASIVNPDKTSAQWRLYGWVNTNQLFVFYDYVAFEEGHFKELYSYKGDYAEIKKTGAAIAWPWPGAGAPLWTIEDLDTSSFRVSYAYTDEQGREWGFVTYLYGSPNIWFCLSDPLNRDIPAFNPAPEPTPWESETVHIDIGKSANPTLAPIIVLVVALVIGTVVLIKLFWKPNRIRK